MVHKRRWCHLLLIGLLWGSLLPALLPRPAAAQDPASQVIALVNQLRASLGLYALTPNGALSAAAQRHANWMAANLSYTHSGEGGSSPQDRATAAGYQGWVAENIVGGTNLSPQQGLIWWQNSPIHYAGMTSSRYIEVGAGYARGGDQNMYVMVFGVPSDRPLTSSSGSGTNAQQAPAPVIITPVEVAAPREDGSIVHVVQIGQTAWDIAAAYDVDLATLLRLNRLGDDPLILPGDEIVVRPSDQPTPGPTEPQIHIVETGETAWDIAAEYDVDLNTLLAINGLTADPLVHVGDAIIVALPEGVTPPPTATPPTTTTVQEGQTAWAIALRYGLTLDQLLAMNGMTDATLLLVGQELVIRAPDATPTPEASLTPAPELPPAYTAVVQAPTASPSPTATEPPTPTPAPVATPTPTPPPGPLDRLQDVDGTTLIGVLIVGLGVLGLLGFAGIEVVERIRKPRRGRKG